MPLTFCLEVIRVTKAVRDSNLRKSLRYGQFWPDSMFLKHLSGINQEFEQNRKQESLHSLRETKPIRKRHCARSSRSTLALTFLS